VKMSREELLAVLESVQPGLSTREVLEQSSCFAIKDGVVMTYNDEVACQSPIKLKGIQGAVQAAPLLVVLRKIADEEIEVTQGDGELLIRGARREAGIRMENEIHLPIDQLDPPGKWKPLPAEYAEALSMVQECAGKDLTKFATACVHLHPKYMEAFDNYQLMRFKIKTGVENSTLVKRDSVKHIISVGVTEFSESKAWLHFRNPAKLVISCRRFDEEFLDLGKHLEVDGKAISLPKGLVNAVDCAEVFSVENADDNQLIVEIKPGKMRVKGQGVSGWYRETKKVKYQGPELHFMIAPKLIKAITVKHNEAIINDSRLKVDGGRWVYVTCLGQVEVDKKPVKKTKKEEE
jgi:hypothetical protein